MIGRFFVLYHPTLGYYAGQAGHRRDLDHEGWTSDPMLARCYAEFEAARDAVQQLPCWTSLEVREVTTPGNHEW